jgi:hypothetical protein
MHHNQTVYQTPDFVNIIHELLGDANDPEVEFILKSSLYYNDTSFIFNLIEHSDYTSIPVPTSAVSMPNLMSYYHI